jgi:hypothetical protein
MERKMVGTTAEFYDFYLYTTASISVENAAIIRSGLILELLKTNRTQYNLLGGF